MEPSRGVRSTPPPYTPWTSCWGGDAARAPGWPTFLSRVHDRGEALRPIPAVVVAADLDLKGRVRPDTLVAVDEVLGIGAGHPRGLPASAALPAEGQQVAEAVSVLVLPGHGLRGKSVAWARGRGCVSLPVLQPPPAFTERGGPGLRWFHPAVGTRGGGGPCLLWSQDRAVALSGSSLRAAQLLRRVPPGAGGGEGGVELVPPENWRQSPASVLAAYRPVDTELSRGSTTSSEA